MVLKRRKLGSVKVAPVKRGSKLLACDCGTEVRVDANVSAVTCGTCVQMTVAAPPEKPKAPITPEEKALRSARKLERVRQHEAKRSKLVVAPTGEDLGFVRGWRWKKLFKTNRDKAGQMTDTTHYFLSGVEVESAAFAQAMIQHANEAVEKAVATPVKVAISNADTHTLVDPNGNAITLTVSQFFKLHGLWSGHVKKLIAGLKPAYKGWTKK